MSPNGGVQKRCPKETRSAYAHSAHAHRLTGIF